MCGKEGRAEDRVQEAVEVGVSVDGVLTTKKRTAGAKRKGRGSEHGFHPEGDGRVLTTS